MSYTNQKLGIGSLQLDESEMLASCLDIFSPPKIENQLVKGRDVIIGPVNALGEDGPFEFHMKTSDRNYIFMPVTRLHGGFQIMKLEQISFTKFLLYTNSKGCGKKLKTSPNFASFRPKNAFFHL